MNEAFPGQEANLNEGSNIDLKQIEKIRAEKESKAAENQSVEIGGATLNAKEAAQHTETEQAIAAKREAVATKGSGEVFEIKEEDVEDLKVLEKQLKENETEN